MIQGTLFDGQCQRWLHRKHSWKHTSAGGFNPRRYQVAPLTEAQAREFTVAHHYTRSWPSATVRYGLVEDDTRLVGVCVLGVPMHPAVLTGVFPTLEPYQQSVELSRLVLLDEIPANAESWFVARVFDNVAVNGVRGVVAFSDPVARMVAGRVLMPGHLGIVYQALGAAYTGRGRARTLTMLPDGSVLQDRARAKLLGWERGAGGVVSRLVKLGAPPKPEGQPGEEWLTEALDVIGATQLRHPGNHRYAFRIGTKADRRATTVALPALPYPKQHQLAGVAA